MKFHKVKSIINVLSPQSSKVPNLSHNEMAEGSKSQVSNHARKKSQVNTYVEITKYKLIHHQMQPASNIAFHML